MKTPVSIPRNNPRFSRRLPVRMARSCAPGTCKTVGAIVTLVATVICLGLTIHFATLAQKDPRADKVCAHFVDAL